jgi:flavin-dependent dehydrogenase
VLLRFRPWGYCGVAPVNESELNVCLVTVPARIDEAKRWAAAEWNLDGENGHAWRTITPLTRAPVRAQREHLLLVGDAACVVEPFTGEGIFYALASGMAAARCIINARLEDYLPAHRSLYRGRLWINHLARWTTLHPHTSTILLRLAQTMPSLLTTLTHRVVRAGNSPVLP